MQRVRCHFKNNSLRYEIGSGLRAEVAVLRNTRHGMKLHRTATARRVSCRPTCAQSTTIADQIKKKIQKKNQGVFRTIRHGLTLYKTWRVRNFRRDPGPSKRLNMFLLDLNLVLGIVLVDNLSVTCSGNAC